MKRQDFIALLNELLAAPLKAQKISSVAEIDPKASLLELNLIDSFALTELLLNLEQRTGTQVNFGQQDPQMLLSVDGLCRLFCAPA